MPRRRWPQDRDRTRASRSHSISGSNVSNNSSSSSNITANYTHNGTILVLLVVTRGLKYKYGSAPRYLYRTKHVTYFGRRFPTTRGPSEQSKWHSQKCLTLFIIDLVFHVHSKLQQRTARPLCYNFYFVHFGVIDCTVCQALAKLWKQSNIFSVHAFPLVTKEILWSFLSA